MAEGVYNRFKLGLAQADEDWGVSDYRSLLLTGTVTFDATDVSLTQVIASGNTEAVHASYTRQALTSEAAALDGNVLEMTCATINYGALTAVTPTGMVVYRHVDGTNGNDLPASFHDTGFGAAANGAGYTITISANGLNRIT